VTPGTAPGPSRPFLEELHARAASRPRALVFPEGAEPRVAAAVASCLRLGSCTPRLIGRPDAVRAALKSGGSDPDAVEIVDTADPAVVDGTLSWLAERRAGREDPLQRLETWAVDPLMQAGWMVGTGRADGAVAGCARTTADVVRAGLVTVGLQDGLSTLSSSFYMVFDGAHPYGPSVLTFTDAGVVPEPDADQLAHIAVAATRARERIVGDVPRVAFLSYSTKGSAAGPSVARVREALDHFRRALPDVAADGELQGDAALNAAVAARKAPGSPVGGEANVLVFPDLSAANIAYKLVQYLGGAVALGPILQGLRRPFNDLSRGASAPDIASVACVTSLMAD
jgi:phosphate acetyltransferase